MNLLTNQFFHATIKDCKTQTVKYYPEKGKIILAHYCLTHKKLCCRCGWQFGRHWGKFHSALPKNPKIEMVKISCPKFCGQEINDWNQKYCHRCGNKLRIYTIN